jgi:hypothetical protein
MPGGRPKYKPTEADRNTVRSMAATGFTHEQIATCLGTAGIDPKTMREHFAVELDTAANKANAVVANRAYQMAVAGNPPAATFFWLKCRAGWKDSAGPSSDGAGGGKTSQVVVVPAGQPLPAATASSPAIRAGATQRGAYNGQVMPCVGGLVGGTAADSRRKSGTEAEKPAKPQPGGRNGSGSNATG